MEALRTRGPRLHRRRLQGRCSRPAKKMTSRAMTELPRARPRVVIIGGGVNRASVAYHLARLGWTTCAARAGAASRGTTCTGRPGRHLRASENETGGLQYPASCIIGSRRGPAWAPASGAAAASPSPRTRDRLTQPRRTRHLRAYQLECEPDQPAAVERALPDPARTTTPKGRSGCPRLPAQTRPTLTAALAAAPATRSSTTPRKPGSPAS